MRRKLATAIGMVKAPNIGMKNREEKCQTHNYSCERMLLPLQRPQVSAITFSKNSRSSNRSIVVLQAIFQHSERSFYY